MCELRCDSNVTFDSLRHKETSEEGSGRHQGRVTARPTLGYSGKKVSQEVVDLTINSRVWD